MNPGDDGSGIVDWGPAGERGAGQRRNGRSVESDRDCRFHWAQDSATEELQRVGAGFEFPGVFKDTPM